MVRRAPSLVTSEARPAALSIAYRALMDEIEAGQLKQGVEQMHGGSARFAQSVPVRQIFDGKPVWEGVVHVFDLTGHPTASRAYAWSSPIEGSTKRRSSRCYTQSGSPHR